LSAGVPTLEARIPDRPAGSSQAGRSGRVRHVRGNRVRATAGRWGLRGTALLYLGVMIALPVAAVLSKGFGGGLAAMGEAFREQGAGAAIRLTLLTSAGAAIINGVFGTLLAYVLVRFRFPGKGALGAIVDMPFAVPTLVTGVMLVALYGPNAPVGRFLDKAGVQVIFAPLGILLALLFVTLPLVVRTVEPVLLELDRAEEEAAKVLGASAWTTFRKVVFPAIRPALAAGLLLTFARAIGEFGSIVVVSGNIPNRTLTAPVFIFQLASQFKPEEAAAVAALLFTMSFALVLITERLVKRPRSEP
jgi:sulfate/thiosulfate transport system permease protein